MPTRILFVDDEPDLEPLIRQKYRKQLRRKEVELAFASNGREALEVLDGDEEFDLIITDINMPVMTGLELLGEISNRSVLSPVIVLSAYGDMANIRTAMNRGAFDFLTKPIDFSDLAITQDKALAHLESTLERSRLQREKDRLQQRAHFIRETFGRYLSDSVVETLLDQPEGLRLGGEKRELSILMSDLRGFTSICERLDPELVVSMLNGYFGVMIDIILAHGGTIDELLGDAVLVLFGAPLGRPDHADQAVRCAIAMQRAMEAVNADNAKRGLPQLEMGIAINTGEAIVGNIGSRRRAKYGVVGSHVNLTARIEALTVGRQVLISDQTRSASSLPLLTDNALTFTAKGFEEPVRIHELRGLDGDPPLVIPRIEPQLRPLSEPIPVRLTAVATVVSRPSTTHHGHIVRASAHHCEIESRDTEKIDVLSALSLKMAEDGVPTMHGKVTGKPRPEAMLVRFTSLPPQAAERLEGLAVEQAPPTEATMLSAHDTLLPNELPPRPAAPERPDPMKTQNHLAALGLMMAGVAHDIRNPLGFIIGFAESSRELSEELSAELDAPPTSELRDTLESIRANLAKIKDHGTRASDLIATMTDTIRGNPSQPVRIDLNQVVSRHLDLLESSLRSATPDLAIEISRELDDDVGLVCIAAQDVSRIVLNLVQNACDAALGETDHHRGGTPPQVVIKTRSAGANVELRVFDNGTGIAADVRSDVFEPLFTTKGARDGLGLGLALVRQIVEAAGGRIDFETEEHEFTEFVVTLPREPPQPRR